VQLKYGGPYIFPHLHSNRFWGRYSPEVGFKVCLQTHPGVFTRGSSTYIWEAIFLTGGLTSQNPV